MRHITAGVIGHVDHGKTTLVKHLTGVDTDRLTIEKQRGMSIELGFAPLRLPSGQLISIIDCPGHEAFLKNMIRGVSGVDFVILVVAADEGIMPQTREHLEIATLMGVKRAVGIITKTDLVDDEVLELAKEEVKDLLAVYGLPPRSILHFSARNDEGTKQIIAALQALAEDIMGKRTDTPFRLCIDRVFTLAGHGTVVTGTISSGYIEQGEEVEIYPEGIRTRIKRLECYGAALGRGEAGQRVGINLHQVKVTQVHRGDVLGRPGELTPSLFINARFHYLGDKKEPLVSPLRAKVYTGTTEAIGRMVIIDREELMPGGSSYVQFRLESPVCIFPFDHFIVRRLSPPDTLGGGAILEIDPPRYRRSDRELTIKRLEAFERGDYASVIELWSLQSWYRPLDKEWIARRLGYEINKACRYLDPLIAKGVVVPITSEQFIHKKAYDRLKGEIIHYLTLSHERDPLQDDFPKEETRTRISPNLLQRLYDHALQSLQQEGLVSLEAGRIRLTKPPTPQQKGVKELILLQIEAALKRSQPRPLPLEEITEGLKGYHKKDIEATIGYLLAKRRMIKLENGRFLLAETLEEIKKKVAEFIGNRDKATLAEIKELLGIGRMQTQPILEHLDKIRFTVRIGDYRVLAEPKEGADTANGN